MARKIVRSKKDKGNSLTAIYTGDTKNFNKFHIVTDGYVGSVYFPIAKDIKAKTVTVKLVTPSDDGWEDKMETLIDNTSSPKALANLKKCLNKHN